MWYGTLVLGPLAKLFRPEAKSTHVYKNRVRFSAWTGLMIVQIRLGKFRVG